MKKVLPIILLLALTSSAYSQKETLNEKLVKRYFEYFNKHNWVDMANMYAENAEFLDPSFGKEPVNQTRDQVVKKYTQLSKMFPDLHDQVTAVFPAGKNTIVVEFISTGSSTKAGKFKLPICTIFTIENGKIIRDNTYYDAD